MAARARPQDFYHAVKRVLNDRRETDKSVRPSRVVGRAEDGRALLVDLSGECVQAGGSGGYMGEIVTELPSLRNREGTTGVPVRSMRNSAALLWVDALVPNSYFPGQTNLSVTVVGHGFTPSTTFEFLNPESEEVNEDITLFSSTFVDSEHYTLVITIAPGATLITDAPLAYDDPSRTL
jgi:hypothetical protein